MKPRPIPPSAPWLDHTDLGLSALRKRIVRRAHADIGIEEGVSAASGGGTNRSPYLDRIAQRFGSPIGSAWCALVVGHWLEEAGAAIPPREVGAVRAWEAWAKRAELWQPSTYRPVPGDVAVYDFSKNGIPDHIGVVARVHARGPRVIEGNTSWAGHSREGVAVVMKPKAAALVRGYITPREA